MGSYGCAGLSLEGDWWVDVVMRYDGMNVCFCSDLFIYLVWFSFNHQVLSLHSILRTSVLVAVRPAFWTPTYVH